VEDVGAEGDERWERGVGWGKGYLEAEDCWGVGSWERLVFPLSFGMEREGGADLPFRTNITPDQSVGSPGVRDMNTPCGQAYLRLELWVLLVSSLEFWREKSTIPLVDAASAQRRGLIRVAVPSFCDTEMFGDVVVA
jgi:hypothetical protein